MNEIDPGKSSMTNENTPSELVELFSRYRERLRVMVCLRLDRRLRNRIDASDVIQEAFIDAAKRYDVYRSNPTLPEILWIRFLVAQRLLIIHRHYLGTKARDAGREVALQTGYSPGVDSEFLADQLVGNLTSPSRAAVRVELRIRVQAALEELNDIDREVLVLRHFEQLSNVETSQVLGIQPRAASGRYIRALQRMKQILSEFDEELPHGKVP